MDTPSEREEIKWDNIARW